MNFEGTQFNPKQHCTVVSASWKLSIAYKYCWKRAVLEGAFKFQRALLRAEKTEAALVLSQAVSEQ
jgi:hypothetical protein